ncbi:MAG: penicillin acylase family protein [Phycisphaeraceae bacterium]|nr:penicillin acylase family protein [Phycisphaeraceae bacterium]
MMRRVNAVTRRPVCRTLFCGLLALAGPAAGAGTSSGPDARRDGELRTAAVEARLEIQRDASGAVRIAGASFEDVIWAQGFVHAQERFFQMDTARRLAAGRLAELGGAVVAGLDRAHRPYGLERVARTVFGDLDPDTRRLLVVYADGVNAGLADLAEPPPEYGVLGAGPMPWQPADTLLVDASMALMLSRGSGAEISIGAARAVLPQALMDFLLDDPDWASAPLLGAPGPASLPVPGPEVIDLSARRPLKGPGRAEQRRPGATAGEIGGSNAWVVAGSRTTHGGALLASDPHLPQSLPPVWFRMQLEWEDRMLVGATLPGAPGVIIGSNGHVAWGFTNAMVDVSDWVIIERRPGNPRQYRGPRGWLDFSERVERIDLRGGGSHDLVVEETIWGPVLAADHLGRPLALRWTGMRAESINLDLLRLRDAMDVDAAIEIGAGWAGPPQNMMVADAGGRIGWVVTGWLPERQGFDGSHPVPWDEQVRWVGPRAEADRPWMIDPPDGILWTANNRTVDVEWARTLSSEWAEGFRARQIRSLLQAAERHDEQSLLSIQLDTRVDHLEEVRGRILMLVQMRPGSELLALVSQDVRAWNGHADVDSRGLALLDRFHRRLHARVIDWLTQDVRWEAFNPWVLVREASMRRLIASAPAHLVPGGYASWMEFQLETLLEVAAGLVNRNGLPVWGEVNTVSIEHPLRRFGIGPPGIELEPLPGHRHSVRVQTPTPFGASMRLVVSPGQEGRAIFQLPGGQSGLWASSNRIDGFAAWRDGVPAPLLIDGVRARFVVRPLREPE